MLSDISKNKFENVSRFNKEKFNLNQYKLVNFLSEMCSNYLPILLNNVKINEVKNCKKSEGKMLKNNNEKE